ncbi:MAG: phosphatidylserine decarboxylase family protein [Microthrixaceae bacterium]|jgi:phosphatidylserine decarboxylase|nr:phosphatidylserine decarboxylase family protein [Microthrixaceae bacterium]
MKIDRDGFRFAAIPAVASLVALARGHRVLAAVLGVFAAAVAAFFRDPERPADRDRFSDDVVISPADAKVTYVGPGQDGVAPEGSWQQVSMFLSLADVHINRCPYGGTVTQVTHRPGRYLAAYKAESAHHNERSEIAVERDVDGVTRRVVFRQVVGVLARRVVTRVSVGDQLATGERIGLMRFGSRMDVFLPMDCELVVSTGQRVVAGETVIARFGGPG